jgi:hypothetical protein
MIVAQTSIQAKWGRGDEVVAIFKEMFEGADAPSGRIMTDLSGEYFTILLETSHEDLAAWEASRKAMFEDPAFSEGFAKTADLVKSGSLRFFTVEADRS